MAATCSYGARLLHLCCCLWFLVLMSSLWELFFCLWWSGTTVLVAAVASPAPVNMSAQELLQMQEDIAVPKATMYLLKVSVVALLGQCPSSSCHQRAMNYLALYVCWRKGWGRWCTHLPFIRFWILHPELGSLGHRWDCSFECRSSDFFEPEYH